jgi:hypothetical protein
LRNRELTGRGDAAFEAGEEAVDVLLRSPHRIRIDSNSDVTMFLISLISRVFLFWDRAISLTGFGAEMLVNGKQVSLSAERRIKRFKNIEGKKERNRCGEERESKLALLQCLNLCGGVC